MEETFCPFLVFFFLIALLNPVDSRASIVWVNQWKLKEARFLHLPLPLFYLFFIIFILFRSMKRMEYKHQRQLNFYANCALCLMALKFIFFNAHPLWEPIKSRIKIESPWESSKIINIVNDKQQMQKLRRFSRSLNK